ncbi:MAG: hypothetical protein U1F49_15895, partial [Rubrivivax sp.]
MTHRSCPPPSPGAQMTRPTARAAVLVALLVTLAACGGGGGDAGLADPPPAPPPPPPPPVQPLGIDRHWTFSQEFFDESTFQGRWQAIGPERYQASGEVHEEIVLDPPGTHGEPARAVEVYSNASGNTYWVSAESPRGSTLVGESRIGSEVELVQQMAFRKRAADATLKFVITHLDIEARDGNPSPSDCQLQAADDEDCAHDVYGWAALDLRMVAAPVPNPQGLPRVEEYFYETIGASVNG